MKKSFRPPSSSFLLPCRPGPGGPNETGRRPNRIRLVSGESFRVKMKSSSWSRCRHGPSALRETSVSSRLWRGAFDKATSNDPFETGTAELRIPATFELLFLRCRGGTRGRERERCWALDCPLVQSKVVTVTAPSSASERAERRK